jgi:hypothetical protein
MEAQVQVLPPKKHIEDEAQALLLVLQMSVYQIEHSMQWMELLMPWSVD